MKVVRTYKLQIQGNKVKTDTARYLINRFKLYVQHHVGVKYFNGNVTKSTDGCGQLFNQAQHKAKGIIKSQIEAKKATGMKTNIPEIKNIGVPCNLEVSKDSSFDYWVSVSNQFEKCKTVRLPVKSHKALNKSLKNGWSFCNTSEVKEIKGNLYVYVFVQKEVNKAKPSTDCIGVDVGYKNSIATSDGYLGKRTDKVIKKQRTSQKERYKQRMKFNQKQKLYKDKRSSLKQLLDKEAKYLIRRSKLTKSNLVIESSQVLSNLRSGKLQGWARCYLSTRLNVLAKENEVFVLDVNPAYSSQTCSVCSHVDKKSRQKKLFKCTSCHHIDDSDVNAAKVLSLRGQSVIFEKILPKYHDQEAVKSLRAHDV